MQKSLIEITYSAVTIDSAKQTASINCSHAEHVAYVVVATSSSSPVGTTLQIQGSLDDVNFVNLNGTVSVTGNGAFTITLTPANTSYKFYRLSYARSSGSYIATTSVLAKGDEV